MDAYDSLRELEAKIAEWEADDVYPGDRGYQDMLERRDRMREDAYRKWRVSMGLEENETNP